MAQSVSDPTCSMVEATVAEPAIELKTSLEVARMRRSGRAVAHVLHSLRHSIHPGTTTHAIASNADELLESVSLSSSLRGYRGFPSSICTSVNHVAVHGIPDNRPLEAGDLITVDLTAERDGWLADAAWTYALSPVGPEIRRLVRASWLATVAGIDAARAGGRFGDIGAAIEAVASRYGCRVLDRFVGHGIGRHVHEDPMVLHTGEAGTGAPIVPGMVFTIEPILTLGRADVFTLEDGWSMVTSDQAHCAQFEHTVAVFGNRTEVLTWTETTRDLHVDYPPWG